MHHHINKDGRAVIAAMYRQGYTQADIARTLSTHRASICRELRRNVDRHGVYRAWYARRLSATRRRNAKRSYRRIENDPTLSAWIEMRLCPLVSPEVVAHELGVVHETIYAWIARSRPDLYPRLPQRGRKRRRYGGKRAMKQGWTMHVRSIDERPESLFSWEGDTVKGVGRARILTHVERTSLYTRADLMSDGTADSVHAMLTKNPLQGTITYDRGSEFALWSMIERDTDATVFFAHPHHPWERGKNENTNGRLRRVFPKRFDFSTITQRQLDRVVELMNCTPRKSLSWRTPADVFEEMCCGSG